MITLYHSPRSRSFTILWFLEELGVPYEVELVRLQKAEHKAPAYLAKNPAGKVPAVERDGVVCTERSAIITWLGDLYPAAGLAPAIDSPARADYLRWLAYAPGVIEPNMMDLHLKRETPPSHGAWGTMETMVAVLSGALRDRPWLLGETFSGADVMVGSMVRWGLPWKLLPETPELVAYLSRLEARPALRAAVTKEEAFLAG